MVPDSPTPAVNDINAGPDVAQRWGRPSCRSLLLLLAQVRPPLGGHQQEELALVDGQYPADVLTPPVNIRPDRQ